VKRQIMETFKIRDLGNLDFLLGTRITRTPTSIKFDQAAFATKILHEFDMENCKTRTSPMDHVGDLEVDPNEPMTTFPFGRAHGMLQYLTNTTQYLRNPQKKHVIGIKNVLRYLNSSRNNNHPLDSRTTTRIRMVPQRTNIDTNRQPIRHQNEHVNKSRRDHFTKPNSKIATYRPIATHRKIRRD
jgi:hypothetical protein